MRVAAQIIEDLLRAAERLLRIDHPCGFLNRFEIAEEGGFVFERFDFTEELKLILPVCGLESFEKEPAEQTRKHLYGKKETGAARDPFEIGADAAARNDEMDVGMMQQILTPGVKNPEETDLGSEVLRIARDGEQGF